MRIGVSVDGKTLKETKIVQTPKEFNQGIQTIKQVADEISEGEKIEAVAGGTAGPLDNEKTTSVASPHLPDWNNKPLKTDLEKIFNCRVILENDAYVSGIGEAVKGAGAGQKVVAYIAIGTGVGGKRIVDGKIYADEFNFEPGHQIIVINGDPCTCGGKGHLETYVSGSYFEKKYGKKGEEISDPQVWNEIIKYLAVGLTNTIVHWSPDIVVLGGAVMKSISLDTVNLYLKEFLTIYPNQPEIVKAMLGDLAGLYGGLTILKTRV